MEISRQEYKRMQKSAAPKSPVLKNCGWAFLIGGTICTLGEVVFELCRNGGLSEQNARVICSVSLIALSVLLTAFRVYDNIAKHAGAGTLVPITGFANSIAAAAVEFKTEGFVLGMAVKMFTIAGPVIVNGTVASVVYGVIYWIVQML